MSSFPSSLDRTARIVTVVSVVILIGGVVLLLYSAASAVDWLRSVYLIGALLLAGLGIYLFLSAPRAVEVEADRLLVKKRLGAKELDLGRLREARRIAPQELKGLIRLFGVGGLFGWTGIFRSKALGIVHFQARRMDQLVLLEMEKQRWVVSADDADGLLFALTRSPPKR